MSTTVEISTASLSDLPHLETLWWALYRHQAEHGMRLSLPPEAFTAWRESVEPFLGRFAQVTLAALASEPVGFVTARIRTLPPYFGRGQVGVITEVFVVEHCRSKGVGKEMLDHAMAWYRANDVRRLELQVVAQNPRALAFYETLGWRRELLQLVKD
jgi:GNAT superfamily N-acetyltransferase